jgi:SAM-dependent methyltransferase
VNHKDTCFNGYSKRFYDERERGSTASARAIVPIVMEVVGPRSVIDVGCGTGAWLAVFQEHGIEDVCGVDGAHVAGESLRIAPDRFVAFDLTSRYTSARRFDLVVSLEVAEHLPPENAASFVASLCDLAPAALFSAAVPFQGGTGHVNEQWPEYWASLFERHGFQPFDCVRPPTWNNEHVEWWYAQNTLLFVSGDRIAATPALRSRLPARASPLSLIHPRSWLARNHALAAARALPAISADLARIIPEGAAFVLVDQSIFDEPILPLRRAIPFLERHGVFWGLPDDSASAIAEVERQRHNGARFIVFVSMAFWCLEYYAGLADYLTTNYPCVLRNERLVVFSLPTRGAV